MDSFSFAFLTIWQVHLPWSNTDSWQILACNSKIISYSSTSCYGRVLASAFDRKCHPVTLRLILSLASSLREFYLSFWFIFINYDNCDYFDCCKHVTFLTKDGMWWRDNCHLWNPALTKCLCWSWNQSLFSGLRFRQHHSHCFPSSTFTKAHRHSF